MSKYGRGLGKEIYMAVNSGEISQPITVSKCREFALSKGWEVPESYLRVVLTNSERRRTHSDTYKDYFVRVSRGKYTINPSIEV